MIVACWPITLFSYNLVCLLHSKGEGYARSFLVPSLIKIGKSYWRFRDVIGRKVLVGDFSFG